MNKAGFLLALLLLLTSTPHAAAQATDDGFRHHVIVILDRSGSMTEGGQARRAAIENLITIDLKNLCYVEDSVLPGRKLLDASKGDYLSIVSFGLNRSNPNFEDFIQTQEHGINYGFAYEQDFGDHTFRNLWDKIDQNYFRFDRGFYSKGYSVISVSLPLSVFYLRYYQPLANRTFLVLITDNLFNGEGDPDLELSQIVQNVSVSNSNMVLPHYKEVRTSYLWSLPLVTMARGGVILKLFELESLAGNFAIESVLAYDEEVTFFRVPDGYETQYQLRLNPNPSYQIEKLEATVFDGATPLHQQTFLKLRRDTTLTLRVARSYFGDSLMVQMRFWVHALDGAYGAHVLHPESSRRQGRAGLNRSLLAVFDSPGRIWFIFPMLDPLYDVAAAVGIKSKLTAQIFWHVIFFGLGFMLFFQYLGWILTIRNPQRLVSEKEHENTIIEFGGKVKESRLIAARKMVIPKDKLRFFGLLTKQVKIHLDGLWIEVEEYPASVQVKDLSKLFVIKPALYDHQPANELRYLTIRTSVYPYEILFDGSQITNYTGPVGSNDVIKLKLWLRSHMRYPPVNIEDFEIHLQSINPLNIAHRFFTGVGFSHIEALTRIIHQLKK